MSFEISMILFVQIINILVSHVWILIWMVINEHGIFSYGQNIIFKVINSLFLLAWCYRFISLSGKSIKNKNKWLPVVKRQQQNWFSVRTKRRIKSFDFQCWLYIIKCLEIIKFPINTLQVKPQKCYNSVGHNVDLIIYNIHITNTFPYILKLDT